MRKLLLVALLVVVLLLAMPWTMMAWAGTGTGTCGMGPPVAATWAHTDLTTAGSTCAGDLDRTAITTIEPMTAAATTPDGTKTTGMWSVSRCTMITRIEWTRSGVACRTADEEGARSAPIRTLPIAA